MGTSSIFGIGLSGLNAAQAGLVTTGHNIANVNTPGYTRQQVLQSARTPEFSGAGYFGQGTNVDTVRRVYSEFLTSQVRQSQSSASELTVRDAKLTQVDNLMGDSASSLAPALDDFFSGIDSVAARPTDIPARQVLLSSGQALVSRFHQLGEQLAEIRSGVNAQIDTTVGTINSYATQIAGLNQRIAEANAVAGNLSPPNDLLDQRDSLVLDLNQNIGAVGVEQSDGSLNVFLSNGQALVVGEDAYALKVAHSVGSPVDVSVGLQTPGGLVPFRTQDVTGGALGALLKYRDGVQRTASAGAGSARRAGRRLLHRADGEGVDAGGHRADLGSGRVAGRAVDQRLPARLRWHQLHADPAGRWRYAHVSDVAAHDRWPDHLGGSRNAGRR
jgi:flagellar hook-associated protein 1 FlgK